VPAARSPSVASAFRVRVFDSKAEVSEATAGAAPHAIVAAIRIAPVARVNIICPVPLIWWRSCAPPLFSRRCLDIGTAPPLSIAPWIGIAVAFGECAKP
jgi:hypothetical protein